MPQAANIVINDTLATPVAHTFTPIGPSQSDQNEFWYEDQSFPSSIGNWKISIGIKRPAPPKAGDSATRVFKVRLSMHQPVLETVSNNSSAGIAPAPTVSYIPRANVEFMLPERSTLQQRRDIRAMLSALLTNAQTVAVVDTLQVIY